MNAHAMGRLDASSGRPRNCPFHDRTRQADYVAGYNEGRYTQPAKLREIDVIDVNREWGVWAGSPRHGYLIGTVRHADRYLARQEAKRVWPNTRIGYLTERTYEI